MSELTKRLRETQDDWPMNLVLLEREAADRIDRLEECLRECLKKGSRWHPCDPVGAKARALLEEK